MSWWSDGEPLDEYDPPWCDNCDGGDSKACIYDSRRDYEYDKALEQMEREGE